ncbi:universal stress protein [Microbacterium sp. NPDC012755]|uniref:universal stress protein n=1 Tax=Microbacterium sp. NPDC012755 TaxID=3364184 RepID=UPI00369FCCC5
MEQHTSADRIVVGVDGSESSVEALRYAAPLAEVLNAPLEAVITWTYPPFTPADLLAEWHPEQDAEQILADAVTAAFGEEPPSGLTRTVLQGPPAATLIDVSETSGMLVLGSRGHGGFVGLLLGSVSAACAEHAHCPVLIVHGSSAPAGKAA